jgi:hypothetical protein
MTTVTDNQNVSHSDMHDFGGGKDAGGTLHDEGRHAVVLHAYVLHVLIQCGYTQCARSSQRLRSPALLTASNLCTTCVAAAKAATAAAAAAAVGVLLSQAI